MSKKLKTSWDFSFLLVESQEKEKKIIQKNVDSFANRWQKNNKYLTHASVLKKALDEYEKLYQTYGTSGKYGYYLQLKYSCNQLDTDLKADVNKWQEFEKDNQNKLLFFELNLAKIKKSKQKEFLLNKDLLPYKHFLEKIFRSAKYNLEDNEEKIMNLRSTTARTNWIRMMSAFLSKEERIVVTEEGRKEKKSFSEIFPFFESKQKKVRDSAALAVNDILEKHADTAEHELNSVLQDIKVVDHIRNIDRPDRMMHIHDDLETKTVDMMVNTISKHFTVTKDFYKTKAQLLGEKKLQYHERVIPYSDINKNYNYPDAVKMISKHFHSLDRDFGNIFDTFIKKGLVDVYPQKGKRGGAYCAHNLKTHPTYIFLNYTKKFDDILTFAHEAGHGINNEMMRGKQNSLNFSTPLATAEIASTFFEGYIIEKIMETMDEKDMLALMIKRLDDDTNTIFRQVAADLFQRELHKTFRKKGYLSRKEIGSIFQKHMKNYMGSAIEQSKGSENWWIYWSHIRVPFYNYQYAFGFLIAKYFLKLVREDKKNIEKFKTFLSAGSSDSPESIFKEIGIDITTEDFWQKGISETKLLLNETKKLAKKKKLI